VTPDTVLLVDNQPVAVGALRPGQAVLIRSGEVVAASPAASPPTAVTPGSTVIVQAPPAGTVLTSRQTLYGRVSDVERGQIKVKTDDGNLDVKVPPEVAAQLRKGDAVRIDLTFNPR
jgi:hypothetical protein